MGLCCDRQERVTITYVSSLTNDCVFATTITDALALIKAERMYSVSVSFRDKAYTVVAINPDYIGELRSHLAVHGIQLTRGFMPRPLNTGFINPATLLRTQYKRDLNLNGVEYIIVPL
jgi:hypothetical protein